MRVAHGLLEVGHHSTTGASPTEAPVAGQRRVLAIVDIDSADDLDRIIMGRLPLREYLEFEAIWPLRTFESFIADCKTEFAAT